MRRKHTTKKVVFVFQPLYVSRMQLSMSRYGRIWVLTSLCVFLSVKWGNSIAYLPPLTGRVNIWKHWAVISSDCSIVQKPATGEMHDCFHYSISNCRMQALEIKKIQIKTNTRQMPSLWWCLIFQNLFQVFTLYSMVVFSSILHCAIFITKHAGPFEIKHCWQYSSLDMQGNAFSAKKKATQWQLNLWISQETDSTLWNRQSLMKKRLLSFVTSVHCTLQVLLGCVLW